MSLKLYKIFFFASVIFMCAASFTSAGQAVNGNVGLRTVVIDPGHGGKDPGAPGPDSKNCEKNIVLKISKLLGEKIKKAYPDVNVFYTRSTDVYPTLTDRVKIAHKHSADLFLSIHCNSSTNRSVYGSSAHILSRKDSRNPKRDLFDESVELTKQENSVFQIEENDASTAGDSPEDQILNTLLFNANYDHSVMLSQLIIENLAASPFRKWGKGIHQNDFLLLKKMTCPAILVETGFLSNAKERQLLISDKWQEEIAQRLFVAFKEYKAIYDASVNAGPGIIPDIPAEEPEEESSENVVPRSEDYYGIQIMGLGRVLKASDPGLKGLSAQALKAEGTNIYKYVYGTFTTKEEAKAQLQNVRKKFPEAFVVKVSGNMVTRVK